MNNIDFDNLINFAKDQSSSLRDYQIKNKIEILERWKTQRGVMLQMPTGTGKTRLFASLIRNIVDYGSKNKIAYKILVLVHRTELIDQIDEELGIKYHLAHGIIQSRERERKNYPVQIASVQTLSRRLLSWTDKAFDFIIVDEAHHITADSYQKIVNAFPNAKLLGVTATPYRLSGLGFTETFQSLITSPSVLEFINKGYLSKYQYYSIPRYSLLQKQIDKIKKFSQGDYAESEIERICNNEQIRAQVVDTYLEHANGKKGIVYTINQEHNRNLCAAFREKGIKTVAIDSNTDRDIRDGYIEDFKNNKIDIICNVNIFSEGFDCPDIEVVILARPTLSLSMFLQQVGRGLRKSENIDSVKIIDLVGLYNKFGFPSSFRPWGTYFIGNKEQGANANQDSKTNKNSTTYEKRNTNLSEGDEEVVLIHTPDDYDFLRQEIGKLWEEIDNYHTYCAECVDKVMSDPIYEGVEYEVDYNMDFINHFINGEKYNLNNRSYFIFSIRFLNNDDPTSKDVFRNFMNKFCYKRRDVEIYRKDFSYFDEGRIEYFNNVDFFIHFINFYASQSAYSASIDNFLALKKRGIKKLMDFDKLIRNQISLYFINEDFPKKLLNEEFSKKSFSVYPNKMIDNNFPPSKLKSAIRYLWNLNLYLVHEHGKVIKWVFSNYQFDEDGKLYEICVFKN